MREAEILELRKAGELGESFLTGISDIRGKERSLRPVLPWKTWTGDTGSRGHAADNKSDR